MTIDNTHTAADKLIHRWSDIHVDRRFRMCLGRLLLRNSRKISRKFLGMWFDKWSDMYTRKLFDIRPRTSPGMMFGKTFDKSFDKLFDMSFDKSFDN